MGVIFLKKLLLFVFLLAVTLCGCGNRALSSDDFADGSLLFDMGAGSAESIEQCTLIDDGAVPEILLPKEEYNLFAKYRYESDYPSDKLHELMVFPTNKLINISVGGNNYVLYLRKDGSIGAKLSEEAGFKLYQADVSNRITPEKYEKLIKKYAD